MNHLSSSQAYEVPLLQNTAIYAFQAWESKAFVNFFLPPCLFPRSTPSPLPTPHNKRGGLLGYPPNII